MLYEVIVKGCPTLTVTGFNLILDGELDGNTVILLFTDHSCYAPLSTVEYNATLIVDATMSNDYGTTLLDVISIH